MGGFAVTFVFSYVRNKQKMFLYLLLYFITNILCNSTSIPYVISDDVDVVTFYFILSEIFYVLSFYVLILLLEVFDKNIEFSFLQTVLTILAFIVVGLLLAYPDTLVEKRMGIYIVSFGDNSLVAYLEPLFFTIAGFWLLIILIKSRKEVKSQKQKTLITRLTIGFIFTSFVPLLLFFFEFPEFVPIYPYIILIITITNNIGIFLIGFGFHQLRKYPWLMQKQKVFLLLIYNQHGINLFHKVYDERLKASDSSLLSGGFSAISSLITEATHSEGQVKSIIMEGKELKIINQEYFVCALIVEYSTQASEIAHKNFSSEFQKKFSKELKTFDGEVSQFLSAEELAVKYFS